MGSWLAETTQRATFVHTGDAKQPDGVERDWEDGLQVECSPSRLLIGAVDCTSETLLGSLQDSRINKRKPRQQESDEKVWPNRGYRARTSAIRPGPPLVNSYAISCTYAVTSVNVYYVVARFSAKMREFDVWWHYTRR